MKIKFFIATVLLFLGVGSAHAGPFEWRGSITFFDGSNYSIVNISGASFSDCESQRVVTKALYAATHTVVAESPCKPVLFDPDIFILDKLYEKPKFPWPDPVCLSCPYLIKDILELIYPDELENVLELKDKFRIDEYNLELQELNERYNVKEFNQELFDIGHQMRH